jgi:hypothetical protein
MKVLISPFYVFVTFGARMEIDAKAFTMHRFQATKQTFCWLIWDTFNIQRGARQPPATVCRARGLIMIPLLIMAAAYFVDAVCNP